MRRQQFAQAAEARVALHVAAHVVQRARDVLDVHRVAARDRLEAERAERLQVALQRHQVEAPAELLRLRRRAAAARGSAQREEERDQLLDLLLREIHVGVAQQRHQIVGVGAHPRVLEVDDVEPPLVQHQVAAVIVAMAQHARLGGQFLGDRRELGGQRLARRGRQRGAAIALEKVLGEELQLPGQLLDVERDAVRHVRRLKPARRRAAAACR